MIFAQHWLYLLDGFAGVLVGAYDQDKEEEEDDTCIHVRGNPANLLVRPQSLRTF